MSALPPKLQIMLKQLRDAQKKPGKVRVLLRPANEQSPKRAFLVMTGKDIKLVSEEVKAARTRLEDVHSRLSLTIKSGHASESIH